MATLLLWGLLAAQEPAEAPAAVYNVTLATDSAPDFTDIDAYLRSITSRHATPQEKAIAVWTWSQRLRKQTSYPTEDGHVVNDPILFFTSYGYTMCGMISGIDNALWLKLGWKARYVQLGDHTVCECSWDGGKTWHMFDNSTSIYCFNDRGEVASVAEIEKNPRYYLENFAPGCGTNPVKGVRDHQGWRSASDRPVEFQRSLASGVESFAAPNELIEDHLAANWGRRYVLNLRPGESYTRHFDTLDGPRAYRPLRGKDVDGDRSIRGSGVWVYAPDLRTPATRALVHEDEGVSWTREGVKGPGRVIFKVSAANVVTSARLTMEASGATASVSGDAGLSWEPVGGPELPEAVAGRTEYLLKVELAGADARLSSLRLETLTQLNRPSLPGLVRGPNRVQLRLGPQLDTITLAPPIVAGQHRKTASEATSVAVNGKPYFNVATLLPAAKDEPGRVTWRVAAPTSIVSAEYGGNVCVKNGDSAVRLLHSFDGKTFVEDFRKADGRLPYDLPVQVPVAKAPPGSREIYFRYEFETRGDPGKTWAAPGIQSALMTVRHQPRTSGFTPIEVTYCWVERREEGDVERRHTELATSPAHEYTVNVGGYRDPRMKWVRMNLKGSGPEAPARGYSDGKDVGPGAKARRARYRWGRNLALGKRYGLDTRTDPRNPDDASDLTDGVIAPPETYVSRKWMPTNVMFPAGASPAMTLDLGKAERVAAVVVHAGAEPGFRLTFPDAIAVETSLDGQSYARAGSADWKQVFEPEADFVPGELDDARRFDALPAGGRLAHAYRIVFQKPMDARYVRVSCAGRPGWGMLLSELRVLDAVDVDEDVPPVVVLPSLK
jgi:hypothetical protein